MAKRPGISVSLDADLAKITEFLDDVKRKALIQATRQSLNKTLSAFVTQVSRSTREHLKVKHRDVKDQICVRRARGNDMSRMFASAHIRNKRFSMIHFVKGNRSANQQVGVPVQARKRIKVEIVPGRITHLRSAFIAHGRSANLHVFQRIQKKKDGKSPKGSLVKMSTPSVVDVINRPSVREYLERFAAERMSKEFGTAWDFQMSRLYSTHAPK
jgi:hypothetical protein